MNRDLQGRDVDLNFDRDYIRFSKQVFNLDEMARKLEAAFNL